MQRERARTGGESLISSYDRAKKRAIAFSMNVDLSQFSHKELCVLHCELNDFGVAWNARIGEKPKCREKYEFMYRIAVMERIADIVGEKAVSKWWNVNYTRGMSEQEYEDWYERKLQRMVLR